MARDRLTEPSIAEMPFIGGRLCLDFTNTANWLDGAACDERLEVFADVLTWATRQGLIAAPETEHLSRAATKRPAEADAMAKEVRGFRLTLRRLFSSGPQKPSDVAELNRALAGPGVALKAMGGRLALRAQFSDLSWLTLPLAFSAVELLTSERLARVKRCPGARCGWLFLDESPTGRRRWCSMASCGNREKAQRFRGARSS